MGIGGMGIPLIVISSRDHNQLGTRTQYVTCEILPSLTLTSGYATMVHGRGCNPHRCTTTSANVEITSTHYDVIDDVITRKL